MRLSVKSSSDGRVEIFEDIDSMSFQDLRVAIIERFQLQNDFSLMCGSQKLPDDANTTVNTTEIGLVSGDRLRLVIANTPLQEHDRLAMKTTTTTKQMSEAKASSEQITSEQQDSQTVETSETSNSLETINYSVSKQPQIETDNAIVALIIAEMKKRSFHCKKLSDDCTRLLFRHAESVLSAEIDFHHYVDVRAKCSHVTISIVHPARRQFLTPIILDEDAKDLKRIIIEYIVTPIRIALIGHDNAFIRLMGYATIAERILNELNAKDILNLERTCIHVNKACNGTYKERVWRVLLERDFGSEAVPMGSETSRNAYQRIFCEKKRKREHQMERERIFHGILLEPSRDRRRHPLPLPPYPRHDPDLPEGPFAPLPRLPYLPPENPFPDASPLQPFQPPRQPRNPLDPFSGSELLPSRPRRPGMPRQINDTNPHFGDFGFGGGGFI